MTRKFLAIALTLLALPTLASAQQQINDYTVHIELRSDGIATVQEEILYDFGTDQRHGIIREIPLIAKMPDGAEREILITNLSVAGANGKEFPFDVSGGGNFVEIKIGDPNMYVRGEVLYVIRYDVVGAIRTLENAKEFYWNVIGNDWNVPISRVRLQVALPRTLLESEVAFACYSGSAGATSPCESGIAEGSLPGSVTMLRFLSRDLPPRGGMTLAVAVPPNAMTLPKTPVKSAKVSSGFSQSAVFTIGIAILLPLITLLVMLRRWKSFGKDPEGMSTVITEYVPPDGVDPLLAGFLLREVVTNEDISALILSLAERGFLSIELVEKKGLLDIGDSHEIILHRAEKKDYGELMPYEKIVLETLFPGEEKTANSADIELRFRSANLMTKIDSTISEEVVRRKLYDVAPSRARGTYLLAAFGIFTIGILIANPFLTPSCILTALIVAIIGWYMPKPTKEGAVFRDRVLGYKKYLSIAEKERIRFHTDETLNRGVYEKLLPYAVVFGLGSAWLARFSEFYWEGQHPTWLSGAQGTHLNAAMAANQLATAVGSLSRTISAASATRASGAGGTGRVGGGFGGGGGRSW